VKYKRTERVQFDSYSSTMDFMNDVIETLLDEDNIDEQATIIADRDTIVNILDLIDRNLIDNFEFEIQYNIFDEMDKIKNDIYRLDILDDGEIFIEKAVNHNGDYYDCDGFIFAEKHIDMDAYQNNNRRCDVMVFDIDE
jgi:hypothetical protein